MSYAPYESEPRRAEPQEWKALPRLLYVGDVPVTSTIGGAALLHRLLETYPADRLRIVQGNLWSELREWGDGDRTKRLKNVNYEVLDVGSLRLLSSRTGRAYAAFLHFTASIRARKLHHSVDLFRPDAIITAVHGFSWLTAATLASTYNLPLHLIIHDDWVHANHLPAKLRGWAESEFQKIYRQASSRLCVSPYMVESYERRYSLTGTVLYPSLGSTGLGFNTVYEKSSTRFPAFAYAGSINSRGYARCISDLADTLKPFSGSVLLFSPHSRQDLARMGLEKTNLVFNRMVPQNELIGRLREEADVLFLPMTFEEGLRKNMEVGFPSKMTDYTATGRPILIWGPKYCSVVRWALSNPGVAEVVSENDTGLLAHSVARLVSRPDYRSELGVAALEKGRQYFSHAAATERLYQALQKQCSHLSNQHS